MFLSFSLMKSSKTEVCKAVFMREMHAVFIAKHEHLQFPMDQTTM